jgi:peptide/nickel transport system substrate-binding protein
VKRRIYGTLVVLALAGAACGGGDDEGDDAEAPAATADATERSDDAATDDAATADAATADAATADAATGEAPATGESITIALGSEPTSLDPHTVDDGGERAVNDNIYETLLARDADGELIPGLATDVPTQVDPTTWEFTLREGVTFHDGTPFNADAVVASVDRIVRLVAETKTQNDGFFGSLTGATKIDDFTVQITTAAQDGVLPARMYWLKIVAPGTESSDDLSDAPNGTGPYKFVERVTGSNVDLEANAAYWDGAPSIEAVRYEFAEESATRLAGLSSGKYDLITNLAPQDTGQAPAVLTAQGQEHPNFILDVDEGITSDPNVRLALNLAVDKDAIVETLFGGFAVVDAGQHLSPSILGHNPDLAPFPYDPDEAKRLIEEAGVAGETIQLVGESGRWLKDKELIEATASYWQEAGLNVQVEILEFGAYLDVLFDRENRADAIFVSSSNDILDPDRQLSTYYQAGGIGSSNSDQALSDLIDQGRQELDAAARDAIYQEAVKIAYDGAFFVWTVNNQDVYGASERLVWTPRVDSKLLVKDMSLS